MRMNFTFRMAAALLLLLPLACTSKGSTVDQPAPAPAPKKQTVAPAAAPASFAVDSFHYDEVSHYKRVQITIHLSVDAPVVKSACADNVNSWMDSQLPLNGKMPVTRQTAQQIASSMFHGLKKEIKKQEREGADFNSEDSSYFEHDVTMKMVCANPRFVTYRCESYYDLNSYNHGDEGLDCVTFSVKDGKRWGWNLFTRKGKKKLTKLFKPGLKKYFGVKTDGELYEHLMGGLPLPETAPYLTDKGVGFIYQTYEIAPFCDGSPEFVVPFDKLQDLLSPEAKELINR